MSHPTPRPGSVSCRISRRAIEVAIAGEVRWAVVEDAGRLRDALGVVVPIGVPEAFLEVTADPLTDLISRYTRTHGPFTTEEVAARFGLGSAVALQVLRRLSRDGAADRGRVPAQATGTEWVEPGVLRRLRSRSLAAARHQVEPVDPLTYAAFLPSWQGVGGTLRGVDGVLTAIDQLAGARAACLRLGVARAAGPRTRLLPRDARRAHGGR